MYLKIKFGNENAEELYERTQKTLKEFIQSSIELRELDIVVFDGDDEEICKEKTSPIIEEQERQIICGIKDIERFNDESKKWMHQHDVLHRIMESNSKINNEFIANIERKIHILEIMLVFLPVLFILLNILLILKM